MTEDDLKDFVNRCLDAKFQEYVNDIKSQELEIKRERQRKYVNSENGYEHYTRGWKLRNKRMKQASKNLSWEEKEQIRNFYKNCPKGYVVDHIIPIFRGGRHTLSNLQYLTRSENAKKCTDIWKKEG